MEQVTKSTKVMSYILAALFTLVIIVGGLSFFTGQSDSSESYEQTESNPFG